ncbi:Protein CHROMATIN REMODELING 20 [Colletotrichum sp. SAR 10_77]|nr:Protein CHROMATIN REMODELING 20 [Colletotrichum sp. SAR 10_77]
MGKDSVLDSLLSTTELSQGICDIETTDTFEEHDPDERSDASRKKSDHGNLSPFVHPAKKKYGNAPVLDNMISRNICMPTVTRRDMSCAERGHVLTKYTQDMDNLEAKAGISPNKMNRCCGVVGQARSVDYMPSLPLNLDVDQAGVE